MEEMMYEMFAEMAQADGFEAWYESEGAWEEYEARMVAAGLDAEAVADFFEQLAWEL